MTGLENFFFGALTVLTGFGYVLGFSVIDKANTFFAGPREKEKLEGACRACSDREIKTMRYLLLLLCLVLGEENNESDFYGRLGVEKDATIKSGFGNRFSIFGIES